MNILQTYETSGMSKDSDHAMHVIVVPSRSVSGWPASPPLALFPTEVVLQELELVALASTNPSNLAHHLAGCRFTARNQHAGKTSDRGAG